MRILIFGDSITHGFFDEQGGWAQRLVNDYHMRSYRGRENGGAWVEGFNLGISGDTSDGVLTRFNAEYDARQLYKDNNIIVFAIGMNDTVVSSNGPYSSPEQYRKNIAKLYKKARFKTDNIIFLGISAVDDSLCNPWKYSSTKKVFQNSRIWEFEKVLRDFCLKNDVVHVPVYESFKEARDIRTLLSDGLHPNDKGHALIASLVRPEIEKYISTLASLNT